MKINNREIRYDLEAECKDEKLYGFVYRCDQDIAKNREEAMKVCRWFKHEHPKCQVWLRTVVNEETYQPITI